MKLHIVYNIQCKSTFPKVSNPSPEHDGSEQRFTYVHVPLNIVGYHITYVQFFLSEIYKLIDMVHSMGFKCETLWLVDTRFTKSCSFIPHYFYNIPVLYRIVFSLRLRL